MNEINHLSNISNLHYHHVNNPEVGKMSEEKVNVTEKVPLTLDSGNICFMLMSSSMLWIMVIGCGFFYSGMARNKSAMSMLILSLWAVSIVSIQWFVFGYSLAFGKTTNGFVGNFKKAFLIGVYDTPYPGVDGIPELAFCIYQGVTATLPASIIMGAVAERGRVGPALLFIFIWTTFVYCPCGYWSLNPNGWSANLGFLDFGGGGPVHVPAGAASLVYSFLLGPRSDDDRFAKPHNMVSTLLGTVLIWFGSFGYNAGSAFGANIVALMSMFITNLSGSCGAVTWAVMDYISENKFNGFGFCAGGVVGVFAVVPASGIVSPASSCVIGIVASIICRWGHIVKVDWKFDDSLDVFAMHGLAGIVGILLTGVFAEKAYGGDFAGRGGWIDGNWFQVIDQLADTTAGFVWSGSVSFIVLYIMNKVPSLRLRTDINLEVIGIDETEMGLKCYEHLEEFKIDSIHYLSNSNGLSKRRNVESLNPLEGTNNSKTPAAAVVATLPEEDEHFHVVPPSHFRNYWNYFEKN